MANTFISLSVLMSRSPENTFNSLQVTFTKNHKSVVFQMLSLKCTCDTTDLPSGKQLVGAKPISNRNLAQVILRWRQIHYSFRRKNYWGLKLMLQKNLNTFLKIKKKI